MRKALAPPPPRPSHAGSSGSTSSVSAEDSDSLSGESLEGRMEISVVLPGGKVVHMQVEKRTPMMDLLVQVTKANNLSPAGYLLDIRGRSDSPQQQYKPNTAIGTLSPSEVHVVSRAATRDVNATLLQQKVTGKTSKTPFEKTFRLRVHLPRNQLHVVRVSANAGLAQVFAGICSERDLAPSRYELRHPVHTEEKLDPQRCLADYGLSEVAVVPIKNPSSGYSRLTTDIMALHPDEERKKRSFFGFMFKKSKSSIGDSSDGHSSRGVSPARSSDGSERQSISPTPQLAANTNTAARAALRQSTSTIDLTNNKINKRKAPAPPPPLVKAVAPPLPPPPQLASLPPSQQQPQKPSPPAVPEPQPPKPELTDKTRHDLIANDDDDTTTETNHSRHSSDSSGYHESSVLCDSPETPDADAGATPRIAVVHQRQTSSPIVSPASSNLTLVNSTSTLSIGSGGANNRKRKAPPPPRLSPVVVPEVQSAGSDAVTSTPPPTQFVAAAHVHREATVEELQAPPSQSSVDQPEQPSSRRNSTSSYASSTSEEVKAIAVTANKSAAPPVPLPRLSKTPISMTDVDESDVITTTTTTVTQEVDTAAITTSKEASPDLSRRRSSPIVTEATNDEIEANDTVNPHVVTTVTESSTAASRRSSNSSSASSTRNATTNSNRADTGSRKSSVSSVNSTVHVSRIGENNNNNVVSSTSRKSSSASSASSTNSRQHREHRVSSSSRHSSISLADATVVQETPVSRKSSVASSISTTSSSSSSAKRAAVSSTKQQPSSTPTLTVEAVASLDRDSRNIDEENVKIDVVDAAGLTPQLGESAVPRLSVDSTSGDMASWKSTWSDGKRSDSSIASRGSNPPEFDLTVIPPPAFLDDDEIRYDDEQQDDEVVTPTLTTVTSASAISESDPSLLQIDGQDSDNFAEFFQKDVASLLLNDVCTEDADSRRSSADSVISGVSSSQLEIVPPPPPLDSASISSGQLSLDRRNYQKKIAAEIDEAFASIDYGDSSEDDDEKDPIVALTLQPEADSSVDPVITWEYQIPEVPPEFQNESFTTASVPPPIEPVVQSVAEVVSTTVVSKTETISETCQTSEVTKTIRRPENSAAIAEQPSETPSGNTMQEEEEQPQPVVQRVRRGVYQRPVVNFSISTYRTRAEEETKYEHKLTKSESLVNSSARPVRRSESSATPMSPNNLNNAATPKFVLQSRTETPVAAAGQAASIVSAFNATASNKTNQSTPNSDAVLIRRAQSELQLNTAAAQPQSSQPPQPPPATEDSTKAPEQAAILQEEYAKLHQQFLHWQQQLLHNQTVLQQQQIVPTNQSANNDTLRRIQEMQQQFSSLPPMIITQAAPPSSSSSSASNPVPTTATSASTVSQQVATAPPEKKQPLASTDYVLRSLSLPRPKSTSAAATKSNNSSVEQSVESERTLPRVGPRPWRPVSVAVGSWQNHRANQSNGGLANNNNGPSSLGMVPESEHPSSKSVTNSASTAIRSGSSNAAVETTNQTRSNERASSTINIQDLDNSIATAIPTVSIRDRISSLNVRNVIGGSSGPTAPPAAGMNRALSQGSFPRNPTVKGFVLEPQSKTKVTVGGNLNVNAFVAATTTTTTTTTPPKTNNVPATSTDSNSQIQPGVVRVNISAKNVQLPQSDTTTNGHAKGSRVLIGGSGPKQSSTSTYLGDPATQISIISNDNSTRNGSSGGGGKIAVRKTSTNVVNAAPTSSNGSREQNANRKFTTVVNVSQKRQQVQVDSPPPPPPPPPPVSASTLERPVTSRSTSRQSSTSPRSSTGDVRDELMGAIRDFGGRTGLKKVDSSETRWQSWHGGVS